MKKIYLTEHIETKWEGIRIASLSFERANIVCSLLFPEYQIIGKLIKEMKYYDTKIN